MPNGHLFRQFFINRSQDHYISISGKKHLGFLRGDALCISGFVNVFSAFELWSPVLKLLTTPSPEVVTLMVSHLPLEKEGSGTINGDYFMFLICG